MNSSLAKIEPQRSAIWILLSTCVLLVAVCTGCQPEDSAKSDAVEEETPIEVSVPDPLTVLVVDAPELGPQIKRQWRARRDGELTVLDVTAAQWHQSNYETEATSCCTRPVCCQIWLMTIVCCRFQMTFGNRKTSIIATF